MRPSLLCWQFCAFFASSSAFIATNAHADDSHLGLSISIERVAGVAYGSAHPTTSDSSIAATTFGIGGPAINPIALPRAGADVILPMSLTLGAAVGVGNASLSISPDDGSAGQTLSGTAWLVSPRIGYLLRLGPMFDLWPRVGVTVAGASLKEPDGQTCSSFSSNGVTTMETCTSTPGGSDSLFFAAASVDLAAAIRLTKTFNVLGGIAYDHVFAASGSQSSGGGGSGSNDLHPEGRYLGLQLWFGLSGYVL
jgi:hypothetical protein